MRKVKCSRKSNTCWLATKPQHGRGGIVPISADYVIPLNMVKKKKTQSGAGHQKGRKKKSKSSSKKTFKKKASKKQ